MRPETTTIDFDAYLDALLDATVIFLENPSSILRELRIEPWGDRIFLLPKEEYTLISEGLTHQSPKGITLQAADPLTVWPIGPRGNYLVRGDGYVVWDGETPGSVFPYLSSPQVLAALRRLEQLSGLQEAGMPRADFVSLLAPPRRKVGRTHRDDLFLLLIEYGIVENDENDRVFLTKWGQEFTNKYGTSS